MHTVRQMKDGAGDGRRSAIDKLIRGLDLKARAVRAGGDVGADQLLGDVRPRGGRRAAAGRGCKGRESSER